MKGLSHPVVSAFGATSIATFTLLKPLASPSHNEFYHWVGPVSALLVPVLVNFAGVWLCLTVLLLGTKRRFPEGGPALSVLLAASGWTVMNLYKLHRLPHADRMVGAMGTAVCLLLGVQALLAVCRWHPLRELNALAATILGFAGLAGVLMVGESLTFSWRARDLNAPRALHASGEGKGHTRQGRILWIVFDELSYRQVYERPYSGLELPAFRRLAETSVTFSHVVPSGLYTDQVLPSLMAGRTYDRVRTGPAGRPLEVHQASGRTWERLDPYNTVFQDALLAGYRTGVAGWYVPYCRIIPEVLDKCFWTSSSSVPYGMSASRDIGWNSEQFIVKPLLAWARLLQPLSHGAVSAETASHRRDYETLAMEGDKLLEDPSMTFVLLHMPIPHPVGIYNRRARTFQTDRASYLDNLALCDLYLAHVREEMESLGSWEQATVLVMGDHSWRVHLGVAKTPEWTEEEQAASDNARFDDRPMYLVKLPHERKALRVDAPFEAVRTRELVDEAISGKIRTAEELAAWGSGLK